MVKHFIMLFISVHDFIRIIDCKIIVSLVVFLLDQSLLIHKHEPVKPIQKLLEIFISKLIKSINEKLNHLVENYLETMTGINRSVTIYEERVEKKIICLHKLGPVDPLL